MTLAFYFFRQFTLPFVFGTVLFLFVLLLDRLFDIIDLIFNKGVHIITVGKLFSLFIPTILPLTLPMATLLACLVTFGRLSEENELTAVRAAGIPIDRVLWLSPLFALLLSLAMVPFNTQVAPWANKSFREIYEKIATADPLINIEPKKFFSLKNLKIYAESIDKDDNKLRNLFVYQLTRDGRPAERIFAKVGEIRSDSQNFMLVLHSGQIQRYDQNNPARILHTSFESYSLTIPLNKQEKTNNTRFRNISNPQLKQLIREMKSKNLPSSALEAEYHLRYAIAFASLALILVGIPLATVLKKGGRGFGFGVSLVVLFIYYTTLILGLTLAEKGALSAAPALWMANTVCIIIGTILIYRLKKQ